MKKLVTFMLPSEFSATAFTDKNCEKPELNVATKLSVFKRGCYGGCITFMKLLLSFFIPVSLMAPLAMAEGMDASAQSHFVFNANGDATAEKRIADALEANYSRISADLRTAPAQPFHVFAYTSWWQYARSTGNWGASGSIEGINKLHLLMESRDGDKAETVAVHEFSHAVVLKLLADREQQPINESNFERKFKKFPIWLWEAIAVYEAEQFTQPKSLNFISKNSYPNLDELSERTRGSKIYKVGYTIIEYILAEYGQDGLINLIAAYGDVNALKTTKDEFAKGWHSFVVKKYL